MVSLLDDIASVRTHTNVCGVGQLLKQLPAKESEALLKAIDNTDTSMAMLAKVLEKHGHKIHRKSLLRHRKRGLKEVGCACDS
jgi:DNA-binding transcriptional regulator WhiA